MEEIQMVQISNSEHSLLKKENIILLFCSLGLGLLCDLLFYGKPLGISYPLFVIAFYAVLFWNLREGLRIRLDFTWLLSIPIVALSFTYLLFANNIFKVLNFMAIPVLIVAHTLLLTSNNRFAWFEANFLGDLIYGMIARPLANLFKPFSILAEFVRRKGVPGRFAALGKVLIGLLVSIPLLMMIVSLLASADEVFNHWLGQIPNLFENININEFIGRTILVLLVTCVLFSYFWSLINQKLQHENLQKPQLAISFRFLDPVTVITILILVNIIYVIFTLIQFSYLFGSLSYGLPQEFTYAQYARRGFFELVAVTLINLMILLGNMNLMKPGQSAIHRLIQVLNSILVACTLILLFSAHFRMSLYEEMYGFTYLRVLTHAFMAYLLALLAATLYKVWKEKISLLKAYIIISVIAYTIINYANIDVGIAKGNIERYHKEGQRIDISYLTSLSYDAVPDLINFMGSGLDSNSADRLENSLYEKKKRLDKVKAWQSFNVAEYRAKRSLAKVELSYKPMAEELGSR